MIDPIVIVGIGKIDSSTQNIHPKKIEYDVWAARINLSAADAVSNVINVLPDNVRDLVHTVIVTSSQGDAHTKDRIFNAIHTEKKSRVRPKDALIVTGATIPAIIMQEIPSAKDVFQVDSACASSLKALELAGQIAQTKNKLVLITGVDFSTGSYIIVGFNSLGALSTGEHYYSPFDKNRSGFAIGEGAAVVAVCSESFAKKHNLDILATVDSVDTFSHCTHLTAPTNPVLLENFLTSVVNKSQRRIGEFAYWDAHATATPIGDETEFNIFSNMFSDMPISSFKGRIGHCLNASGAIEIVNAIENLQKNQIPYTYNIVEPMNNDSRIIAASESTNKKTFIKCSFGFAGRNGAAVITIS
jgi:3-oxoacyl-[acyl-carrier-protein] synthase II